jgi:transcriptional regulator with XRE-family HTH domain
MRVDRARRRRAASLRARGLTFGEIGRRLGVTRQAAASLVRAHGTGRNNGRPPVCCRDCEAPLNQVAARKGDHLVALCPECAAGAPFGQRLKAHRLAAGLTLQELGRGVGLAWESVARLEAGRHSLPHPATLEKLVGVLGESLGPRE